MNIAILIDAENVLPGHADLIFGHAQKLGNIVYKEIYGAATALTSWVAPVLKYAIHPNLTIKAAKGKNSSDIALVIGAMDLLVAGGIDCAIIASSDSDFSSLSVRLRNAGLQVVGMGTEKANALWRTACSSFVVLQNAKPAQAQKQQEAPAPAQEQPSQKQQNPSKKSARPVAASHEERANVIGQLIAKQLEAHGGRLQVSTLFPTLNRLPEYRVDRQGSGKRPLNYLTSTYGTAFRFEETPDGQSWVSLLTVDALPEAAPAPETPAQGSEPAREKPEEPAEAVEAPVPEAEPVREAEAPQDTAPAAGEAASGEQPEESYVTPQQVFERLVEGGFDPEIAQQVTEIFANSTSYRAAYNKLRSVFGNSQGREYYQEAKQLLGGER